jgi:hypothetical protein
MEKIREFELRPFNFDGHARRRIEDVAVQPKFPREVVHERTEANTLHDSPNLYVFPENRGL